MMRTFLAIALPDAVRDQLVRLQGALTVGRLVPAENLHLTIAFLGEQPDALLDEVHLALEGLRADRPEIALAGLDTFGGPTPRVLFAGVRAIPALSDLHKRVRGRLRIAGLDLPHERFRPHVTLARFGAGLGPDDLARLGRFVAAYSTFAGDPFIATQLTFFESVRTKAANRYLPLADYPLGQAVSGSGQAPA